MHMTFLNAIYSFFFLTTISGVIDVYILYQRDIILLRRFR